MAKAKIMIVEDEAITAVSIRRVLMIQGYEVCELAATGEQAIERVEKERPDLVLMDILLAGSMDGIEAAREIQRRLDIPVVFLTGYHDEDLLEKTRHLKSVSFLLKPFNPQDVQWEIDQALQKHTRKKRG
ncbi:MAG: response regulator [Deltaproteobacteria bacterium]|nr:response regulator [Deltaproteobacteria bacterium]MBW2016366.1 response regulator [Deltaproteobacteria bacterium]MBW2128927.1 response regulator [Deltaproteobacteria bacterium]MBW2304146.1 response regulator [Deltaproteobacteria bacterium]